jgi:single-strand DNA-binding protein
MFNKIIVVGNLGADPELRYTANEGVAVANFSLATNYQLPDGNKETTWFRVTAWRKLGENCANYLSKGSLALVEGRLRSRKFTDNQGIERTTLEIIANTVRFLTPKGEQGGIEEEPEDEDVPF